jgi:hypothetical protein
LRWVADDCPAERQEGKSKGTAWSFELAAVVTWLREQARIEGADGVSRGNLAQIERRRAQVDLELAELRLAELRSEVLRVDDVLEIVGAEYDALRRVLAAIPARMGPELWAQVTGGATELQVIEALEHLVDDVQRTLSDELEVGGAGKRSAAAAGAGVVKSRPAKSAPRPRAKSKVKTAAAAKGDAQPVGGSKPAAKRRGKR